MLQRFLITLTLFISLTACGQSLPPVITPDAPIDARSGKLEPLVSFNPDGYATLRGRISGSSQCPDENGNPVSIFIEVEMPVNVQGIESYIAVPFRIEMQTKIASSLTSAASAQDFFAANPQASFIEAFALYQTVEISFSANEGGFLAAAIRETAPPAPDQLVGLVGVFATNTLGQGIVQGSAFRANWAYGGSHITWIIAIPYTLHNVPVDLRLPVEVTQTTQSVFRDGRTVIALPGENDNNLMPVFIAPNGNLRIEFMLKDNLLEVSRIVELE